MNTALELIRCQGIKSLFKGITMGLLGIAPFIAIRMSVYDTVMSQYSVRFFTPKEMNSTNANFLMFNFLCGSIAGLSAVSICYPMDIIKRLM
jgi:hypothetical protein